MNTSFDIDSLVKFPLFKDADLPFIEHLLAQCIIEDYASGEKLTVGDKKPTTFYVVLEGVFKSDDDIRFDVGSAMGSDNLLHHNKRSYIATAITACKLLVITEDDFWRMVSLDPQLVRNLMQEKRPDAETQQLKISSRPWMIGGALTVLALSLIYVGYQYYETHSFGITDYLASDNTVSSTALNITQQNVYTVKEKPVTDFLQLKGSVQPTHWTDITSPTDSVVTKINFRFGDLVKKGQLLAELNTANQQVKLRDSQTAAIKAEAEVKKLLNWERSVDVTRAKRELTLARDALVAAKREEEYSSRLFDKGIVSKKDLQSATESVASKKVSVISAQESLNSALLLGDDTQLKLARLQLENAQHNLEQISNELDAARIYSPTTGIIFPSSQVDSKSKDKQTSIFTGSPVSKNQLMFAIADMVGIAIESDVSEKDVLVLRSGQSAKVKLKALPNVSLDGVIDQVAGRGVVSGRKGALFKVRVVVDALDPEQRNTLRIGMTAEARIVTYQNDKAIVVPFDAIDVESNRYSVNQLDSNNNAIKTRVKIRSTLVDGVEITHGVAVNDRLLIGSIQANSHVQ